MAADALNCGQEDGIQAHHVMRRTLVPFAALDLGNGIFALSAVPQAGACHVQRAT